MNKKIIISIVSVFVIIFIGGFSYSHYNSEQQKEHAKIEQKAKIKNDQKLYDNAITDFYNKNQSFYDNAKYILSDYSSHWKLGLGSGSMATFVNVAKTTNTVRIDDTDILYIETTELLKTISKATHEQPERYEEVYNECKKLYETSSALKEQVNDPSGSYISFNGNVNNLLQEFESTLNIIKVLTSN